MPQVAEPIDMPFACELEWAEESTSSIVFARWRQYALIEWHIKLCMNITIMATTYAWGQETSETVKFCWIFE